VAEKPRYTLADKANATNGHKYSIPNFFREADVTVSCRNLKREPLTRRTFLNLK
jgi:hypothetical protein